MAAPTQAEPDQRDDAGPNDDRGARFWFFAAAIAVPLGYYLAVLALKYVGGVALLRAISTEFDGPGWHLGTLARAFLPGLYLAIAALVTWQAPGGKRPIVLVGAFVVPGIFFAVGAVESMFDRARETQAYSALADVDGSQEVPDFGPIIRPNTGGPIDPDNSPFRCATSPVWVQSAGSGRGYGAEPEIEWMHQAERMLRAQGFDVSSRWTIRDNPTNLRPQGIEARMAVLGTRDDDAILFWSRFWGNGYDDDQPASNNGINAVRDGCVGSLTLAEIDPLLTEPGLPTELPGFTTPG